MTQAARAATSGELALLRTPGDWSRAYLGVYKPNVIYTAVLSAVPTSTDMVGQISFTGGSGTLADVKAEMTLWVATTAGGRNLGICRIRKAPIAGTIYIGYTSEIDWSAAGTIYLTIVDHAMLSKKPVLIDAGAIKMDGEHAYSDQHTVFDPVAVLTPHAVAWLTGASVDVVFGAGDSWVYDSTISSYAWTAPGASATSGMATATATITYNAAGYYRIYCTVTAANGKTATAVRFVMIFDANNKPHSAEIQAPNAEYDAGGWSFDARLFANADTTEIVEGALCILFSEDWYGATKQSIGPIANRENIICSGYIAGESIEWDAESSSVEFTVQGPHEWLRNIPVNPLALTMATSTPASWDVMPALTVDRALWHVLHWRSNVSALLNITLTGDARYAPSIESMDGTLWSQMEDFAWRKIFGRVGCDRFGRFYAVIDPQLVPEADRTWATVMTLTEKDWAERVNIVRSTQRKLAMLSMSGWVTDLSGSVNTLYSLAMGHISAQYGDSPIIDKLLAVTQAQFNTLAGMYVGWKNHEFEFEFTLAENNRMIDLWPNQFLDVTLAAGDTPRGIGYAGNLIPRSITLQPDPETGVWSTEISCEAETFADLAVDGDIPASTGIDDFNLGDFPLPDFPALPDLPLFSYLPSTAANANHPKKVVIATAAHGILYTDNFDDANPTWKAMNSGLTSDEYTNVGDMCVTPSGAIYIVCGTHPGTPGMYGMASCYRASGIGAVWTLVQSWTNYPDLGITNDAVITGVGYNPNLSDSVVITGATWLDPYNGGALYLSLGTGGSIGSPIYQTNGLAPSMIPIMFSGNKWSFVGIRGRGILSDRAAFFSATVAGAYTGYIDCTALGLAASAFGAGAIGLDFFSVFNGGGTNGYIVFAGGIAINYTGIQPDNYQAMAFSPTGTHGMAGSLYGTWTAYKTTDGGTTWNPVSGVIPNGSDVWENCKDNYRWIFGGGTTIRVTVDQGASYDNKMGNLTYIAPLVDIQKIRFVA